uniref:Uncharacterized protein n=1 Tax=Micrurus spixii TaxID=129469 RepID=A0A2D4NK07_9SAUR
MLKPKQKAPQLYSLEIALNSSDKRSYLKAVKNQYSTYLLKANRRGRRIGNYLPKGEKRNISTFYQYMKKKATLKWFSKSKSDKINLPSKILKTKIYFDKANSC